MQFIPEHDLLCMLEYDREKLVISEQMMATFNDKIKDAKKDGMMDLIDVMPVIRN